MKLSAQQVKTFHRIQRKHNVSAEFLLRNMNAILSFVHYATTPHPTLMQKLVRRRNRVFLRYNHLRKLVFDTTEFQKNRRTKRLRLQWSKRLVMYLKAFKTVEFVEDELTAETKLHEEDVSKQLKEQLELLKSGKRNVALLEDVEVKDSAAKTPECTRKDNSEKEDDTESEASVFAEEKLSDKPQERALNDENKLNQSEAASTSASLNDARDLNQPEFANTSTSANSETAKVDPKPAHSTPKSSERSNGKFLDMLISKVKNSSDDAGGDANLMEPPKKSVRTSSEAVQNEERENSNSSSDFFGFDDSERIPGTSPGMLSTPLVQKRDSNAAFESETLNAFLRDNSLESSTTMDLPQRPPEDGLVSTRTLPPKLDMPALPEGLQGLRTVAERRIFLQKSRNVKYCVINNVGTIFRELQKRTKGHRINKNSIETLQSSSTMPLTRAGWKVASWLLTDEGKYYFQSISIDGKDYRLCGSRANNTEKYKKPHVNDLHTSSSSVCPSNCIDRITFRALRPIRTLERRSKLSDASKKVVYKACPLSQKIFQHAQDNQLAFNSLEVVRMPQVELEVFPQLQKPLNDIAKRYLQLILPYDGISREWAEFSVSTLLESEKSEGKRKSFTFKIPYANDHDTVLVRRVFNRSEVFEGQLDKSTLTFRKEIEEKKASGQAVDELDEECADVLTDMLNSVAISCCENSFIKDDPDNIYQNANHDEAMVAEKTAKKFVELHQQQHTVVAGSQQNKKQSRLLMELKRLNATIIDAAASKSDEDGTACEKESCRLGCVCASLNEGTTVRQHCGKQRCILDCNCKCPGIMRLETDGRTITTEDAFMLRRQATAKLARMEKEFTSTIVLTGSETLLINESQYDKKRRCTKVPKRYGDFVDPNDSDLEDCKTSRIKTEGTHQNLPLEPIMVNDKIYQRLKHCTVNVKRLRDFKNIALWCMVHNVYNCFCKGQATVGNPIVVEKQEELPVGGTTTDETVALAKTRTLYSFEKEETKAKPKEDVASNYESESNESSFSDSLSLSALSKKQAINRSTDSSILEAFFNTKPDQCRRVVPIPRHTYTRRNKKRVAHVQLFIAENETEQTKLNLSEHVLRSVYYHKTYSGSEKRKGLVVSKKEPLTEAECEVEKPSTAQAKRKMPADKQDMESVLDPKRSRMSIADVEKGGSLLLVNQRQKYIQSSPTTESAASPSSSQSQEQITVPKISQIFSLNTNASNAAAMGTDSAAAAAADIPKQSTEATEAAGVSSEAFKSVFQVVIRNMNNLVSKKMQDIDLALRRESRSIPVPNDEILCIIRWKNFLTSYLEGFVYLWEIQTANETFLAATIKNVMPLIMNALSVVNIRALSKDRLPLLARMLVEKTRNSVTDGLAVVMQGQKLYWYVKGFLRPDKGRVCPKPTPETHPLLTRKINVLCRLLINQQINEHKKRQEMLQKTIPPPLTSPTPSTSNCSTVSQSYQVEIPLALPRNLSSKLKVLPIQRNISDHAAMILEQMVTQAYGVVQTNVVLRKVRRKEIPEICQPAVLTLDHHWLVLDISSDFSHIFIPELKDLLTLDRIQKVMSYAVNKNRIVKLQFSQKAIFNAYVAPLSRRKLYFGPFRSFNHSPKLVLLQSVDGQMMLREVYEKKHNIGDRPDRTTGFWIMQKRGRLIVDVLREPQTAVTTVTQNEVHEILDDDVAFVPNVPTDTQVVQQDLTSDQKDEDDDCVIIEDDSPAPKERIHYTISYTDENSSLVVIPNVVENTQQPVVQNANDKFTLLTPMVRPQVMDSLPNPEQPSLQNTSKAPPSEASIEAVESPSTDNAVVVTPTSLPVVSGAPAIPTESTPAPEQQLPLVVPTIEPPAAVEPRKQAANDPAEPKKPVQDLPNPPTSAIKLNRNVTITKLPADLEPTLAQQHAPTLVRKSLPATVTKATMPNNQRRLSNPLSRRTLKPIVKKPNQLSPSLKSQLTLVPKELMLSKVISAQAAPKQIQKPQTNGSPQQPSLLQPLAGQRPAAPAQSGLIIRTPTAINTIIRSQQKRDPIRQSAPSKQPASYSLLKPIGSGLRMRVPIASNPSAPAPAQQHYKLTKIQDNPAQQIILKHPILPAKVITKNKQPYTTPQQAQFIRYMKNQAKLVSKLNETIGQPKLRESPQDDPLQITEDPSHAAVSELLQPHLPSEVKTVRIMHSTLRDKVEGLNSPIGTPKNPLIVGSKRNSMGAIAQPIPQLPPKAKPTPIPVPKDTATVVTTLIEERPTDTEFKGIPIDLPRMKKFAIISSPNTTVITPPTPKSSEEFFENGQSSTGAAEKSSNFGQKNKPVTVAKALQNKTKLERIDVPPPGTNSKNLIKVIPTPTPATVRIAKAKSETVPKGATQYGYFQANIEGLPMFVVKRINDDFLVKVPNFNGILKLNGLQTVHNYLNQYTAQKFCKSSEDIANLKWTFKVQDRSKLSSMKSAIQPRLVLKKTMSPSTLASPQSTKAPNNAMPRTEPKQKPIETTPVVLVDDE